MVTVDDRREIRYHRARKAWPCASGTSGDCQGEIAAGERYAEVRHAGLSERTFGKRYCLPCAGALPVSPNGAAAAVPAGTASKDPASQGPESTGPASNGTTSNGTASNGAAAHDVAERVAAATPLVETEPVAHPEADWVAADGGLRATVERDGDGRRSVVHVVRLVGLWVAAVLLGLGALYGTLRVLDWFIQIAEQP